MILDKLENAEKYYSINPGFKKAFEFLKQSNVDKLEDRTDIDGDNVFALMVRAETTGDETAQIEVHEKYIDIQYAVEGTTEFGWKALQDCALVKESFNKENDCGLFTDNPDAQFSILPGQFVVFFPEDGHAPMGGKGISRRIVIKVMVE